MAHNCWGVRWGLALAVGVAAPTVAVAQSAKVEPRSAVLAHQYWEARRAELEKERAVIDKAISAIDERATPNATAARTTTTTTTSKPKEPDPSDDASQNFGGIKLGAGLSFTADLGSKDRIGGASRDESGIVRVSDQNNSRARIMLEGHYFFEPCGSLLGLRRNVCVPKEEHDYTAAGPDRLRYSTWGWGPFVAIQPGGDDKVIDAIGMGLMVGFRKDPETKASFNFGVGLVIDPNTNVLGDGIVANQPLPPGETEVRLKETSQKGVLFLASFSF